MLLLTYFFNTKLKRIRFCTQMDYSIKSLNLWNYIIWVNNFFYQQLLVSVLIIFFLHNFFSRLIGTSPTSELRGWMEIYLFVSLLFVFYLLSSFLIFGDFCAKYCFLYESHLFVYSFLLAVSMDFKKWVDRQKSVSKEKQVKLSLS